MFAQAYLEQLRNIQNSLKKTHVPSKNGANRNQAYLEYPGYPVTERSFRQEVHFERRDLLTPRQVGDLGVRSDQ